MKKFLYVFTFLIASTSFWAHSEDSQSNTAIPIDISHLMKKPESLPEEKSTTFKMSCKDVAGNEILKGEKGYEDCLTKAAASVGSDMNKKKY
jgi:hypothetical protein